MSADRRLLGAGGSSHRQIDRLARSLQGAELAITKHEVQRWTDLQLLTIDLSTRARAVEKALDLDCQVWDRGLALANGDPVKQELVLRYLQDQNSAFRRRINQVLD